MGRGCVGSRSCAYGCAMKRSFFSSFWTDVDLLDASSSHSYVNCCLELAFHSQCHANAFLSQCLSPSCPSAPWTSPLGPLSLRRPPL